MKMDNDVLLLSYLDKIRLTLTGDLRQALASLYSEAIQGASGIVARFLNQKQTFIKY